MQNKSGKLQLSNVKDAKRVFNVPDDVNDTTDVVKARFIFAVLGLLGVAILYALRVNLSVAIVTMVNNTAIASNEDTSDVSTDDVCPGAKNTTTESSEDGEFVWNEERQGLILSGFFYGYAIGQLPGGLLAERFGGKLVFGLGTFITAVLTVISPFSVWLSDELFFVVRLLEGLAEGVTFPAIQFMISKWAPPQERSRFSIIFSGGYLGTVICMPVSGLLCAMEFADGWPLVFYVFGGLGILWYIPWLFLVYDSPAQHPRISPEERRYIEASIGTVPQKKKLPIPWRQLLSTPGLWACASMHLGIGWTFFALLTCLPTYMSNVLHYDIKSNSALSAIPYITGGVFSVIFSWALDFIITRGYVSKLMGYRIFNGITAIGPALTLIIITLVGCDNVAIIVLLAINGLCLGAQYTGNSMNLLLLAPNFAGTMLGISNTFANGAGILAPYAVGFLTNGNQTRTAWNIVFYLSAGIGLVTYVIYMLLCSDKEQPWNNPSPLPEEGRSRDNASQQEDNKAGIDNSSFEMGP
ncbi:putative inorganic phosphate cotransporter isoform X1 [Anabrus simplex]|uniref:putative inorganic phosphate cotransporter isoform X1 n=1 Tax=Anabrus simplex TaxID=316456 RepID=UPI0035A2C19B